MIIRRLQATARDKPTLRSCLTRVRLLQGRIKTLIYRDAQISDVKDIKVLLDSYDLPASDFQDHIENFVVAERNGAIIGVGGYESCENLGLLRSFAISDSEIGRGIASQIFSLLKAKAMGSGIRRFYLLTTTAANYFERFGFAVCNRDDVPDLIKETKQFGELCPCSAVVMVLDLCA